MKLKNKFLLRFSPLLLIIIIFSILEISTFFSYNQSMVKLKQDIEPEALAMLELKEALTALEVSVSSRSIDKEELKGLIQRLSILAEKHLDQRQTGDAAEETAHSIKHLALRSIDYARYLSSLEEDNWADEDKIRVFYKAIHREHGDLGQILDKHLALHLQDLATTKSTMSNHYRAGIIVIWCGVAIGLLTSLYGIYSLMQMVLLPIKSLQQSIQQVGERSFKDSFSLQTGDEFEELALEFEKMAKKLEKSYHQLDAKVLARTKELSETNIRLTNEIGERKQAEQEQLKADARVHLLTQKILTVQETERKRISLDLHDNVAQELSALKVYSENFALQQAGEESQLQGNMRKWAKALNRCIGTVRDLSYNLRPPSIEQIGITGTLAEYCKDFSKQNELAVDFVSAGMERLSTLIGYEVAINIYRFVQEALNNIQRHAHADQVTVRFVASGPSILLRIEDNGCGCDLAEARERALSEKRLGLLGMQERIQLLHGTIKIQSSPGKGMKISAEIPCENFNSPHS